MKKAHVNRDIELIQRIRTGDPGAEIEFLTTYDVLKKVEIMVHARGRGINHEEKKDLMADIISAVILNLRTGYYDPQLGDFNSYMWGIIRNKIHAYFKENRRQSRTFTINENMMNITSDDFYETFESRELVMKTIRELDKRYQKIILMRYFKNLEIAEIADELKMTRKQVYNQLSYAIGLLRGIMDGYNLY